MKTLNRIIRYRASGLIMFLILTQGFLSSVKCQDLPTPSSNLQTLPTGSYVIPMDNTYQFNAAYLFNLKAYGMVIHLLNNGIRVKWVINSGKVKDGVDATINTEQRWPTFIWTPRMRDLRGGPFVIFHPDTAGVSALVNQYYTSQGLTGNDRPKLLKTLDPAVVDVRYDLTNFIPNAAVLNEGGQQAIHLAFMVAAGIPASNYSVSSATDIGTGCYSFVSEPHNTGTGLTTDAAVSSIRTFVGNGGNFLAQCETVLNYENNSHGNFQSATGISPLNAAIGTTGNFAHANLSFSQFEGVYNGNLNGALNNWQLNSTGANSEHVHLAGTGIHTAAIGASVSKLTTGGGGLVFYLGNHNYTTADLQNINGIRMYMNAFLTPSTKPCQYQLLNTEFSSFSGSVKNTTVELKWTISENERTEFFEVQKSGDGKNFTPIAKLSSINKPGAASYVFSETSKVSSRSYYRIAVFSKSGTHQYSKVLLLQEEGSLSLKSITILENPVKAVLAINYTSGITEQYDLTIYNSSGGKVYTTKIRCEKGKNILTIPTSNIQRSGIYFLELRSSRERALSKFIKSD